MFDIRHVAWMNRGFCVSANPEIFYEEGSEALAKAYCQRCSVVTTCLDWALDRNEEGIWGGTTDAERRALKRGGLRASCPGCGGVPFSDGVAQICLACGLSWLV